MHVAFGMLGFAAVLAATVLLEQREMNSGPAQSRSSAGR